MKKVSPFLFEIGCEELPPLQMNELSIALKNLLTSELKKCHLSFTSIHAYATPRRLAVLVKNLATQQPEQIIEKLGPSVSVAFNPNGDPTPAGLGFARSCGVPITNLTTKETAKGNVVFYQIKKPGSLTTACLPNIINKVIKKLPMVKPMRWGTSDTLFIRPVHSILMLLGNQRVSSVILGQTASNQTYGHLFYHPQPLALSNPLDYETLLIKQGNVIPDFITRRKKIKNDLEKISIKDGSIKIDSDLLDEVTGMTEWPHAFLGSFKKTFLTLPKEVLITSTKVHQRYFIVQNKKGDLLPYFALISNINPPNPTPLIKGNERVIHARLSDALFFYHNDKKIKLSHRTKQLDQIIFQEQLGSMLDKTKRMIKLSQAIAAKLGISTSIAKRAALLAKCDLVTEMVYEFPSLQGIMGYYYASHDQEEPLVAQAIKEYYHPKFAGDTLPQTRTSLCLALADKLDSLIGILGIYKIPTGEKDPFALRRAAIGIVRILIEKQLPLDLKHLLKISQQTYSNALPNTEVIHQTFQFLMERLKAWYLEQGVSTDILSSVLSADHTILWDLDRRIQALKDFITWPQATALIAAHKRVNNLLKKNLIANTQASLDVTLLNLDAEKELASSLKTCSSMVDTYCTKGHYTQALQQLAILKTPVDHFFDNVLVMVDDTHLRQNRLILLMHLRAILTQVADISQLSSLTA